MSSLVDLDTNNLFHITIQMVGYCPLHSYKLKLANICMNHDCFDCDYVNGTRLGNLKLGYALKAMAEVDN